MGVWSHPSRKRLESALERRKWAIERGDVMPEEDFTPRRMHYGIMNGGVYMPVGEVDEPVPFSVDDDGISSRSLYRELTADWSGTIVLKIPWWQQNRVARMLGYRALYYVAGLKRGGKSHKGKARSICRAT